MKPASSPTLPAFDVCIIVVSAFYLLVLGNLLLIPLAERNDALWCPDACRCPNASETAAIERMTRWFGWRLDVRPDNLRSFVSDARLWKGRVAGRTLQKGDVELLSDLHTGVLCMPLCRQTLPWYSITSKSFYPILLTELTLLAILYVLLINSEVLQRFFGHMVGQRAPPAENGLRAAAV